MALTAKQEAKLAEKEAEGYDTTTQRAWLEAGAKGDMPPPVLRRNPAAHRTFTPEPADAILAAINEGKQAAEDRYGQSLTNNTLTRTVGNIASGVKDAGETLGTAAGEFVENPGFSIKQGIAGLFEGAGMDISEIPENYPPEVKARILAERAQLEQEAPASRHLGQLGMQAYVGSRLGAAASPLLGAAAEGAALPGVVGRAAGRTAAAAGTGGIAAGGTAALTGNGDPLEAFSEGVTGGAALHALTSPSALAARRLAEHIGSSKTQLGRGIQAAESLYGPEAVKLSGVKGAEGIDAGERGISQVSRGSASKLHQIGEDAKAAASTEYQAATKGLERERMDPSILRNALDAAIAETETENGVIVQPALRSKLATARDAIAPPKSRIISGTAKTMLPGATAEGSVPVADVLKVKRMLDSEANWGYPPTPEQAQVRKMATAFSKLIGEAEPRLGSAQARYAERMTELERFHGGLYGSEEPAVPDTPTMRDRLSKRLSQQGTGENSGASSHTELQLEDVRRQFPGVANLIDAPTAERFRQDTEFKLPTARVVVGAKGQAEPVARTSLNALADVGKARIVYPAARAAAKPHPGAAGALIEAAEAERERKKHAR